MNDIKVISYRDVMVKDEVLEIEFDEENKSIVRALISGNTELLCNKLGIHSKSLNIATLRLKWSGFYV